MATRIYNAADVFVIYGPNIINGKADGDFLSIAFNEDQFTFQPNTDGSGTRSATNNLSAQITLTLAQSSPSNLALSAAHALDIATPGGVTLPFFVKDNQGQSIYTAESAWIMKFADSGFAKESGTREWVFETDELIAIVGGNL